MTDADRWSGAILMAGVDEVGRGPLAGPVVTAAVILDPKRPIEGIRDSKQLSEPKRRSLADEIRRHALAYSLGRAEVWEIDRLNILHATMLAMRRAIDGLGVRPDVVYVDGNRAPEVAYPVHAVVGGDAIMFCIGAASILAKVERDCEMSALAAHHPGYGFERHKGYGTREHMDALMRLGPTAIHRHSFAPVAAAWQRAQAGLTT